MIIPENTKAIYKKDGTEVIKVYDNAGNVLWEKQEQLNIPSASRCQSAMFTNRDNSSTFNSSSSTWNLIRFNAAWSGTYSGSITLKCHNSSYGDIKINFNSNSKYPSANYVYANGTTNGYIRFSQSYTVDETCKAGFTMKCESGLRINMVIKSSKIYLWCNAQFYYYNCTGISEVSAWPELASIY